MAGLEWLILVFFLLEAIAIMLYCVAVRFCMVRWRKQFALPVILFLLGVFCGIILLRNFHYPDVVLYTRWLTRLLFGSVLLIYVAMRRRLGDADGSGSLSVIDCFAIISAAAVTLAGLAQFISMESELSILVWMQFECTAIAIECGMLILGSRIYGKQGTKLAIQTSIVIVAICVVVVVAEFEPTYVTLYVSVYLRVIWIVAASIAFRWFALDE